MAGGPGVSVVGHPVLHPVCPSACLLVDHHTCPLPAYASYAGGLYTGVFCVQAVHRYKTHWLPLLNARPSDPDLIPPLDVAFVWLCHRLAPEAYARDCQKWFGKVLNPTTPDQALAFDDGSDFTHTSKLWGTVTKNYPNEQQM